MMNCSKRNNIRYVIVLFGLGLLVAAGLHACRSHRATVSSERVKVVQTASVQALETSDTACRRDTAATQWLTCAVTLDWDSIDYHFVWDSAGRVAGVTGSRRSTRRADAVAAGHVSASTQATAASRHATLAGTDTLEYQGRQEKTVETRAGGAALSWLEIVLYAFVLALAVAGVIHIRTLTDKWSKR